MRTHGGDPRTLVEQFHRRSEAEIAPWYYAQIAVDRARFSEMAAIRDGREAPRPESELAQGVASLMSVLAADPDLFRAALEYVATITPLQEILERPEVAQRMAAAREAMKDLPTRPVPGPAREQLLRLVS